MAVRSFSVHEAKTNLSRLLEAVEQGHEVIITRGKMKARLGKLPGALDVARDVLACVAGQGFKLLDITGAHAQHAGSLRGAHRDPFDRMLIAQSLLEGASLATNEELLDEFGVARFW